MDCWGKGKLYVMVVCPIHQLPGSSSQIYQQATTRNVNVFTYSHLSFLVNYAVVTGNDKAEELLQSFGKLKRLPPRRQ